MERGRCCSGWIRIPDRHRLLIHTLRLFWIAVVLWFELGSFNSAFRRCQWPVPDNSPSRTSNILIIADPQILNSRSYPHRNPLLTRLSQLFADLNMRKSWRLVAMKMRPHVVVVLGDMMDGGRGDMDDDEYEAYYRRFKSIFQIPHYPLPVYYLPGNHDTGLGSSPTFSPHAITRYTSHFGPLNRRITIANHSVLFIDAPGLVDEDRERGRHGYAFGDPASEEGGEWKGGWSAVPGGTVEFVRRFAAEKYDRPTVLFTHIPLSRPEGTDCGPLRERGTIQRGAGYGYENTLSEEASAFLLGHIRPAIIFSGDDHDYCSTSHPLPPHPSSPKAHKQRTAPEITVKSLSIAMGVARPGFQLLALAGNEPYHQQLHTACGLPNQLGMYVWGYAVLGAVCVVGVFVANVVRVRGERKWRGRRGRSRSKEVVRLASVKLDKPGRRATLDVVGGASQGARGRRLSASGDEVRSLDEREGEGYVMHGMANGRGPGGAQFLPLPTYHRASGGGAGDRVLSWTFAQGHKRRRVSVPLPPMPQVLRSLWGQGRGRRGTGSGNGMGTGAGVGVIKGFVSDVRSVALPPVGLFVIISWWMFR